MNAFKDIEQCRKKLEKVSLSSYRRYGESDIDSHKFNEWINYSSSLKNIDEARNYLYYGFQPLFDSLISNRCSIEIRPTAVKALEEILSVSKSYLTDYYFGEPNLKKLKLELNKISPIITRLKEVPYYTKFRNIDYNGISSEGILSFLIQFCDSVLDQKCFIPDYIVGCACGSSEIVIPLSGVLKKNIGFIRRSKRRNDGCPKFVEEHKSIIKNLSSGKNVLCIEDYVCSGDSLYQVMEAITKFSPKKVIGASINGGDILSASLDLKINKHKFQIYEVAH